MCAEPVREPGTMLERIKRMVLKIEVRLSSLSVVGLFLNSRELVSLDEWVNVYLLGMTE